MYKDNILFFILLIILVIFAKETANQGAVKSCKHTFQHNTIISTFSSVTQAVCGNFLNRIIIKNHQ